ncbi:hypothetical protein [Mycobacteroides abscessus]|uniref:hypothetical protein n=1 Tax=Mycobacteroides abscessus TaxID=36809 RepID=UPI0009A7E464|nr:hypothetical protein [Mycobacteroides abscessus]SKU61501.1 Uncharacterised protein [Mycobacteroides abscessus subsp. massiliense]
MDADYDEPVDLDHLHTGTGNAAVTECSCGTRRSLIRHWEVTPCASRALARLREAHRPEYDQYLAELKAEALQRVEDKWQRHMAGDHRPR